MTATDRKNTIASNAGSEPLDQYFALVLCQQRIQPVIVKSDVEVVADMAFEEGGRIAVVIEKLVFVQPVCGSNAPSALWIFSASRIALNLICASFHMVR